MKKFMKILLIILILNISFCFAAEDEIPRGSVTLRWEYVPASVQGYAIYLWDGYAYREVDRVHQEVLEWHSDEARIYPKEETLAALDDNSITESLFTAKGKGERLRNNPNGLYRVMKDGTQHSYDEYKDYYLFKIGTINEYGEVILSAPISTRMENWDEEVNAAPEVTITINDGEGKTNDRKVQLSITASDDTTKKELLKMRLANDSKDNFGEWEKYSPTKTWKLSEGYGEKTVFVEVKDKEGISKIASDKILLKEIEKLKFEVVTENGPHATKADNVTLEIKGVDNLSDYNCSYIIDGSEKTVEINTENKINLPLEKKNKNKFTIKLESKDGSKIGEVESIIWKLS